MHLQIYESEMLCTPINIDFQTQYFQTGVQILAMASDSSLLQNIGTSSKTNPASYPMSSKDSFMGIRWPESEADHLPPSRTKATDE
jgi:hypothetical protein